MLMMLAVWGAFSPKVGPADAHDVGCVGAFLPKYTQLMLMMLAVQGTLSLKVGPADAHDAGCMGLVAQSRPS